jgi:hypothetical protein
MRFFLGKWSKRYLHTASLRDAKPTQDIPDKNLFELTIPALIDRIIIGPTRDPVAARDGLAYLLGEAGVEQPFEKFSLSGIPLRQ